MRALAYEAGWGSVLSVSLWLVRGTGVVAHAFPAGRSRGEPRELRRQCDEQPLCRRAIARGAAPQHIRHRRLHGAAAEPIDLRAARRKSQLGAPPISGRRRPTHEALLDQSLQDAGERAGMNMKDVRELTRGETWEQTDDAQRQPLRPGHAPLLAHSFRRALQRVYQLPQQPHELQDFG